jgi:hypothetical protein
LCGAAFRVTSAAQPSREVSLGAINVLEIHMRHFNLRNRHEIRDAKLGTWATLLSDDYETFSELSRNGFYLTNMRGEIWTMRRVA